VGGTLHGDGFRVRTLLLLSHRLPKEQVRGRQQVGVVGGQRLEQGLLLTGDRHVRQVVCGLQSAANDGHTSIRTSAM
jgi:hypothetical protein